MAFQNLDIITLTGRFLSLSDASPMEGTILFTGTSYLYDDEGNEIIVPDTIIATLDGNGEISVELPATDDPDITPQGWYYVVSENFTGIKNRAPYGIVVPYDALGGTVDIADLAPVAVPGAVSALARASELAALSDLLDDHLSRGHGIDDLPFGATIDIEDMMPVYDASEGTTVRVSIGTAFGNTGWVFDDGDLDVKPEALVSVILDDGDLDA